MGENYLVELGSDFDFRYLCSLIIRTGTMLQEHQGHTFAFRAGSSWIPK